MTPGTAFLSPSRGSPTSARAGASWSSPPGATIDPLVEVGAHATIAEHIDVDAEQILEILPQPHEIEQAPARFHLYE
jgi:hypothetical protein